MTVYLRMVSFITSYPTKYTAVPTCRVFTRTTSLTHNVCVVLDCAVTWDMDLHM